MFFSLQLQMNQLRKSNNIHAKGSDMPDLITDFNQVI